MTCSAKCTALVGADLDHKQKVDGQLRIGVRLRASLLAFTASSKDRIMEIDVI